MAGLASEVSSQAGIPTEEDTRTMTTQCQFITGRKNAQRSTIPGIRTHTPVFGETNPMWFASPSWSAANHAAPSTLQHAL